MSDLTAVREKTQARALSDIERCIEACREQCTHILSDVMGRQHQDAHHVEAAIFQQLMKLGLLLLTLFFVNHGQGDYGEPLETDEGLATRGRRSARAYFSLCGKLKRHRSLYRVGSTSCAPLDQLLNVPRRGYAYFLAERVNLLNVQDAYDDTVELLHTFFALTLSVSAVETISQESAPLSGAYSDHKETLPHAEKHEDSTVVRFDGTGVPMIKKEAAKMKGRLGPGEKRHKKKEAWVGVSYTINAHHRSAEDVATNLVFPETKESPSQPGEKAQHIRDIASVERPKKEVMQDIKQEVAGQNFAVTPLICVMDGATCLWDYFQKVFKSMKNNVLILDIIHGWEYIWLIAHVTYKSDRTASQQYVYDKLLLILQGKVSSYILELQNAMLTGSWKTSHKEIFTKVITYLKNHKQYMKYGVYLSQGSPIGSGVVESACGPVVKNSMELPGARWSVSGAEAMLQLRSVVKSQDWNDYWAFYTAHAHQPDNLPRTVNSLNLQQKIPA